jgi:SAM-dependent methyltransferase
MTRILQNNINTKDYWNEVYKDEISKNIHRTEMERFKKVADLIENNSLVVDVGCGTGELIKYLFHLKKGCVFSGIDFSETAINDARKERPNCRFIVDDVLNLTKYYSEVDYIISFETIEHLTEPQLFVNEVNKVLRKGGLFIISTPYDNLIAGEEHINFFVFKDMIDFFENKNGWEIVSLNRYSDKLKNMFVVVKKI